MAAAFGDRRGFTVSDIAGEKMADVWESFTGYRPAHNITKDLFHLGLLALAAYYAPKVLGQR